jgi:ATP-dependent RNA helicase DeaD
MRRFKSFDIQVLIATDVAARGIDVDDLTHVIHHMLPDENSYYTHRSGRTARAGKKGISIVFAGSSDVKRIKYLEKDLDISFEQVEVPGIEAIKGIRIDQWSNSILNAKIDKQVDEEVMTKVEETFKDLSKEDLLVRLVSNELNNLSTSSTADINDTSKVEEGGGRGRGRGGYGNNRGGYGKSRDGGKGRSKGGYEKRSSGGDRGGYDKRSSGGDRKKRRRY